MKLNTDFGESSFSDDEASFDELERRERKKQYRDPSPHLSSADSEELKDQMPSILIPPTQDSGQPTVKSYASLDSPTKGKWVSP